MQYKIDFSFNKGPGTQNKIFTDERIEKIFGSGGEKYWVSVNFIHRCVFITFRGFLECSFVFFRKIKNILKESRKS